MSKSPERPDKAASSASPTQRAEAGPNAGAGQGARADAAPGADGPAPPPPPAAPLPPAAAAAAPIPRPLVPPAIPTRLPVPAPRTGGIAPARAPARGRGASAPHTPRRRGRRLLAVAAVLALVAFAAFPFGFLTFHIPTAAMSPTLQGDTPGHRGDRVLVSRWGTGLTAPGRFDVVVFRHPLDRSRSFVKRVVGLPGEELAIAAGDVFTRRPGEYAFRIARKPVPVQSRLWLPVERTDLRDRPASWLLPDEGLETGSTPALLDPSAAEDRRVGVAYQRPILDRLPGIPGDQEVADLRVRAVVALVRPGGACSLVLHAGTEEVSFRVSAGGKSRLAFSDASRRASAEVAVRREFSANTEYRLELWRHDHSATAVVDGTVWARYEWGDEVADGLPVVVPPAAVQVIAEESPLRVTELAVDRDVQYVPAGVLRRGEPIAIPAGCYFVIGDHCRRSKDSRTWRMSELRLAGGRSLFADADSVERSGDTVSLHDLEGEERVVRAADVVEEEVTPRPFVRDEDLVGWVWAVWWPLERARWVR